jgi:hypothetical protein
MTPIRTGKPDVDTQSLGHTPGVRSGNSKGNYEKQEGHLPDGRATAKRSTGINSEGREPIDPRMPNIPPA